MNLPTPGRPVPRTRRLRVSEADFEVAYDGPAVANGTMDVFEFAPALLAMGKLVRRANQVVNGDAATVSVKVKTSPAPGSFPADLRLILDTVQQQGALLVTMDAPQLLFMLGLLGDWGDGVGRINSFLDLLKRLRGKKPEIAYQDPPGVSLIINIDGDNNMVNADVWNLGRDGQAREYARDMLEPVTREGVTAFQVRRNKKVVASISKEEAEDILRGDSYARDDDDGLDHGEFTKWVYATPRSWSEGKTWHFVDNQGDTFVAAIEDKMFWADVHEDRIHFTEHTQFRVRGEWFQQRNKAGKLLIRHTVTHVLDRRGADDPQGDAFKGVPPRPQLGPGPRP